MSDDGWRKCGPCKKMIPFDTVYYVCNVSTCKKQVFCSHNCWRAHVPLMRHKDAWAEEERSPEFSSGQNQIEETSPPRRKVLTNPASDIATLSSDVPKDILIVASKLKQYVRARSQLNTSASALEALSDLVRAHCDKAIEEARRAGRKTVMDRDFTAPR